MDNKTNVLTDKMKITTFSAKQWFMIATPVILIITMYLSFQGFTAT